MPVVFLGLRVQSPRQPFAAIQSTQTRVLTGSASVELRGFSQVTSPSHYPSVHSLIKYGMIRMDRPQGNYWIFLEPRTPAGDRERPECNVVAGA